MEKGRNREEWIDLLRGLAVLGMIWTHAATAFLADKSFGWLIYAQGLLAPLFFWVAGYMRGQSAARSASAKPVWPTVRRLLVVLCLGYLLHLPLPQLLRGDFSPQVMALLCQSDVLQALAISSLLLLAVERARLSIRACLFVVLALGLAVLLVAQFAPDAAVGFMPVDAYLNAHLGSLFPLVPWTAFACAGFIIGRSGTMSWKLFFASMLAVLVLPHVPHRPDVISFFFERLGWAMMGAVLVMKAGARLKSRWLLMAGRESLCLYAAHLVLIYWVPVWGWAPMSQVLRTNQPWSTTFALFIGLTLVSMGIAWLNERQKHHASPRSST